jgi:hypothetical protein
MTPSANRLLAAVRPRNELQRTKTHVTDDFSKNMLRLKLCIIVSDSARLRQVSATRMTLNLSESNAPACGRIRQAHTATKIALAHRPLDKVGTEIRIPNTMQLHTLSISFLMHARQREFLQSGKATTMLPIRSTDSQLGYSGSSCF